MERASAISLDLGAIPDAAAAIRPVRVEAALVVFSPDGVGRLFSIEHGLAGEPRRVLVEARSQAGADRFDVAVDHRRILVQYAVAPPAGAGRLWLSWSAEHQTERGAALRE